MTNVYFCTLNKESLTVVLVFISYKRRSNFTRAAIDKRATCIFATSVKINGHWTSVFISLTTAPENRYVSSTDHKLFLFFSLC